MDIEKIDTKKHKIKQRMLMEMDVIPRHPTVSVFSGSAGGGKSTLIANMLTKPHMYGKSLELLEPSGSSSKGSANSSSSKNLKSKKMPPPRPYYDAIFLLIGSDDDMYDSLIADGTIRPEHVKHMPTPADIQSIIDHQKKLMADHEGNITKVPKILCIFDDVINDKRLIGSKPFMELFVKGRHINSSTWLLCQYLNLCPKSCRLQASYLFVFKSNRAEMEVLQQQFCPPDMNKQDFYDMVMMATADDAPEHKSANGVPRQNKNNFLVIVKRAPLEKRFRQNLDHYIGFGVSKIDDSQDKDLQDKDSSSSDDESEGRQKRDDGYTMNNGAVYNASLDSTAKPLEAAGRDLLKNKLTTPSRRGGIRFVL
jgi:hypothetical protein